MGWRKFLAHQRGTTHPARREFLSALNCAPFGGGRGGSTSFVPVGLRSPANRYPSTSSLTLSAFRAAQSQLTPTGGRAAAIHTPRRAKVRFLRLSVALQAVPAPASHTRRFPTAGTRPDRRQKGTCRCSCTSTGGGGTLLRAIQRLVLTQPLRQGGLPR